VVPGATTTVLQDWEKSRKSEADDLNGHVVRVGAQLGVPTPMNSVVLELAHRVESGGLEPGPDNIGLMLRAGG
jgi:2-dehydropantoate 2-reductase